MPIWQFPSAPGNRLQDGSKSTIVPPPPDPFVGTAACGDYAANHNMVEVQIFIDAIDLCTLPTDLLLLEVIVTSDEPDNAPGDGDGNTTGDTDGQDGFTAPVDVTPFFTFNPATAGFEGSIFLRAERADGGGGRTYTIEATVVNDFNNWGTSSCVVVVPATKPQ